MSCISLIAAMADNRVIGSANKLPWKLPADMQWFRQHTLGKPIVMGRLTFESFGAKSLPGRTNIVVTGDLSYRAEACLVAHSIEDALAQAGAVAEIMIIGGTSFYKQMLPRAHRMYLTQVHHSFDGDSWFPEFAIKQWREVERIERAADEKNPYGLTFLVLERESNHDQP